jgi:hypothetical protein
MYFNIFFYYLISKIHNHEENIFCNQKAKYREIIMNLKYEPQIQMFQNISNFRIIFPLLESKLHEKILLKVL